MRNEDPRKREFLSQYREQYGYSHVRPLYIDELRASEFPQLKGDVYLDHAGATLYSNSQMRGILEDLSMNLYGNPHSQSDSSCSSSSVVAKAREEVLKFFNAPIGEYKCVFTSGATGALKLVGECFPWTNMSRFWYTTENHNSVLGIREYALALGASACAVDIEESREPMLGLRPIQRRVMSVSQPYQKEGPIYNLFAFPSECNFSGQKFDLNLIKFIQKGKHTEAILGKWMILLDAAKSCGTSPLDLSKFPADFITISFYKIFGYPTGLGALLVRSDSASLLQKKYFGGGTVAASIADVDYVQRRENIEEWLEDGTSSFLAICSLQKGFAMIKKLGISNISMHAGSLAKFTACQLSNLSHENGTSVCVLYGRHASKALDQAHWGDNCRQGPVVTFNLKRFDGTWIGYREVEKLASLNGIHLRTGCFCNPGACSKFLGLQGSEIQANHEAGHVCWDDHDIMDGKPVGAVRVSFGYMSTIDDSLELLNFIQKYFVDVLKPNHCTRLNATCGEDTERHAVVSAERTSVSKRMFLRSIIVYPIKSCAGFQVESWFLGNSGLLYDREWIVMDSTGVPLTQKKCPAMCCIKTSIDLSDKRLIVSSSHMKKRLEIPLQEMASQESDVEFEQCGDSSIGKSCEKEANDWFTEALGIVCTLLRKNPKSRRLRRREGNRGMIPCKEERELSFANEGQFLLVSLASLEDVNKRILSEISTPKSGPFHQQEETLQVDAMRFRPNLIISGGSPFEEDSWKSLYIGEEKFDVLGGCNRCQMININQVTGKSDERPNLLLTLASYRRFKGKILFGLLLAQHSSGQMRPIRVGSSIYAEKLNIGS